MTETIRLLRDLVAIPSINPMGRGLTGPEIHEARMTAYLEDFLRGLGVPFERQNAAPGRDNIVGRYSSPGARRTILLEAHQDTVPIDNMKVDPFGATIDNGRLYGRGACDIKGGMAAMAAAFARVARERPAGAANVWFAATVDEEFGGLGVKRLVRDGLAVDMAVVAEPTQLHIVHAHKGTTRWHLSTLGRSCHSSSPEKGLNAIYRMAGVLVALEQYAEYLRTSPADPILGPPTLSVGRIEGGTSVNTVPDGCRIEIDRRLIPGEDPQSATEQLLSFLRRTLGSDVPFELSAPRGGLALSPKGSEELVERLSRSIAEVAGPRQVIGVPYGTDASTIAAAGIPAVVFGPGDIAKAHTTDEWVPLDEVEQASDILYRLVCQE